MTRSGFLKLTSAFSRNDDRDREETIRYCGLVRSSSFGAKINQDRIATPCGLDQSFAPKTSVTTHRALQLITAIRLIGVPSRACRCRSGAGGAEAIALLPVARVRGGGLHPSLRTLAQCPPALPLRGLLSDRF